VLVRNGEFKEAELVDALNAPGKVDIPGASGKRNLHDNLSDLRAQVAANQKVVLFRFFPEVENKQLKKH
jgi:5-oxoprolinase (ATP-hydrolysing)